MSSGKFDKYFLMTAEDVPSYIITKLKFFEDELKAGEKLSCEEFGDGDVNYIFRVKAGNKSLIVKQAGEVTRLDKTWHLSVERGRIEADYFIDQENLNPGAAPKLYYYDPVMRVIVEEDLSDYEVLRTAFLKRKRFPRLAGLMSDYMVNALLPTSDVVMDHIEKKQKQKHYINPQMCDIFEKLNYMEPFNDYYKRNRVMEQNKEFVEREYYSDKKLNLEAAKLKFNFMTIAQALIHADLHTSAVFVNESGIKVFDAEFAFYGPIGHDLGNFTAHLFYAWANADALGDREYAQYILDTVRDFINLFIAKFKAEFKRLVTEPMAKADGFFEWYLDGILDQAAGTCGIEGSRRTIGLSHIADLETIKDEERRARAERLMLRLSKYFILNRANIRTGEDYLKAVPIIEAEEAAEFGSVESGSAGSVSIIHIKARRLTRRRR